MIPMGCAGWLAFVALLFYIFEDCIEFLFLAECGQDEKKRLLVVKMKKNGSSDQCVLFFQAGPSAFQSGWPRRVTTESPLPLGEGQVEGSPIVVRASCLLDCDAGILPAL